MIGYNHTSLTNLPSGINVGDRVLLTKQTNLVDNGIYVVNAQLGLDRSDDMPTGSRAAGCMVRSSTGEMTYRCIADPGSDVVGTHILEWKAMDIARYVWPENKDDMSFLHNVIRRYLKFMDLC